MCPGPSRVLCGLGRREKMGCVGERRGQVENLLPEAAGGLHRDRSLHNPNRTQASLLDFPISIKPSPGQHSSVRGICLACSENQRYLLRKQNPLLSPTCALKTARDLYKPFSPQWKKQLLKPSCPTRQDLRAHNSTVPESTLKWFPPADHQHTFNPLEQTWQGQSRYYQYCLIDGEIKAQRGKVTHPRTHRVSGRVSTCSITELLIQWTPRLAPLSHTTLNLGEQMKCSEEAGEGGEKGRRRGGGESHLGQRQPPA